MSKQNAAAAPGFLEHRRQRRTAMRNHRLSAARSAGERAPKIAQAKEIENDAQDLAQSEIDGTIDAVAEQHLRAIERALTKIDEGTYGLSDLSGDPIPKALLEAMPEASPTLQEEEAQEEQQRAQPSG